MLHYQISGSGNTIVLLHGFCENSTCFSRQVLLLKSRFRVITIDLPGVADSPLMENLTMEMMADGVHAVLQHAGAKKVVMIGHSLGGYVTLAYAKKYGSMLSGFGLLHSTANADTEERKQKRDQAMQVIAEKGMAFYITNFIPPLFSSSFKDTGLLKEIVKEGLRTTPEALKLALQAMKQREDSHALLAQTDLPVLFIAGKQDAIIPDQDIFRQASAVKRGSVIYLEESAHMGMMEEPEKCASGIGEFSEYCYSL